MIIKVNVFNIIVSIFYDPKGKFMAFKTFICQNTSPSYEEMNWNVFPDLLLTNQHLESFQTSLCLFLSL